MPDITLSAGIRNNLLSLQRNSELFTRTQERLATGHKVSSPLDNPTNYFRSVDLRDRSDQIESRLDAMGQAQQALKVTDDAIVSIRKMLDSMRSLVATAQETFDSDKRAALGKQFNEMIRQVHTMARDANYSDTNLLQNTGAVSNQPLVVQFNEDYNQSTLTIQGVDIQATDAPLDVNGELAVGLTIDSASGAFASVTISSFGNTGTLDAHEVDWTAVSYKDTLAAVIDEIELFSENLKIHARALANNGAVVSLREDFTKNMINHLQVGADKLTLADLNEESANITALQTAQQIGMSTLAMASQQTQSILRLLG